MGQSRKEIRIKEMITKIEIQNIKGYGVPGKELNVQLDPNKINLCVAPNGFGKTSIAKAFSSMNRNRLVIDDDDKNLGNEHEESFLKITLDGTEYIANSTRNEIIGQIEPPTVISNMIEANSSIHHFGRVVSATNYLSIKSIDVCSIVKEPKNCYGIRKNTACFGKNKGILESIEDLLTIRPFLSKLHMVFEEINKFAVGKIKQGKLDRLVEYINSIDGKTNAEIISKIDNSRFAELLSDDGYNLYLTTYASILNGNSTLRNFDIFWQLLELWKSNSVFLKQLCEWSMYLDYKDRLDANIKLLDSSERDIKSREKDGKLIVEFPHADKLSNGQRDVITFATQLMIFKSAIREDKKYMLIIDEVFDYLDDANTMAAQYYLSKIVNTNQGNIYILLLTHLNPRTFRNYVFHPRIINEVYLEATVPIGSVEMMSFISFRSSLDKKDANQKQTYDKMSSFLFHYNPKLIDMKDEIEAYHYKNVKSLWGRSNEFRVIIIDELNKYLSYAQEYDPYAVAIALRHRVEKIMYEHLSSQELKDLFIETHKTNNKLEFCEQYGILVPDSFFIVNSIHNESDHLRQNPISGEFEEKSMVYKLQNKVIRSIVEKLFHYQGSPLGIDCIS